MHPSRQGQAPDYASGFVAGGATIDRPYRAFLAYPHGNYAAQPEWHDMQHYTMVAPVVEPNDEGLDGTAVEKCRVLTLSPSNDKRVHARRQLHL